MFAGSRLGQMPAGCPAPTLQTARATGLSLLEAGAGICAKLNHKAGMRGRNIAKKRGKKSPQKTGIKVKRDKSSAWTPCKVAILLWS